MKKFAISWIIILLLSPSLTHAQEITLHFPHFSGQQYDWKIFQGGKNLAVQSGKIPPDGWVALVMPEAYKAYRGMTRWMLKKGGGLDMIYTGKGFSVECLSEHPSSNNIIYKNNSENDYLSAQGNHQQTILKKLGAINHLLQVYSPEEVLHKTAIKEQESLRLQFEQTQADRSKSPLYAARFGEIVDFTRGVADKVYENQDDHVRYFNDFLTHTLNFMVLYTSGHWDQVLHSWLMMNISAEDGDAGFENRLDKVLKRITQNDVLNAFICKTVPFLVKKGKDDLLPGIVSHLDDHPNVRSKLPDKVKNILASVKIMTGKKAPDLMFKAPVRTQTVRSTKDITIETGKLDSDYTILLFYQGECPLCEDALIVLANRYKWLKKQNVRVIAISSDTSDQGFEKKLKYHQWPDNYCDFEGITGENFVNYGVLGVPTLFLLDQKGIILKKTAMVNEVLNALEVN